MSDASVNQTRTEVARCVVSLLLKEPFYGHLLAGLVRNFSGNTPTAAVALTRRGVELWINPEFFMKQLRRHDERVAVIKHEALHLLYKHLFRVDPQTRDLRLFNIAADLVVNQFVTPWTLPEGAILLSTFPDLNLEPDQTMDHYYRRLAELMDEIASITAQGEMETGKEQDEGSKTSQKDYSQTSAPKSAEALDQLAGSTWHSDHSGWSAAAGGGEDDSVYGGQIPDGLIDGLRGEIERQIIQAKDRTGPKAWGTLPGVLRNNVDAMIERRKPKVSWKRVLRLFSSSSRRTRIVATSHRQSKRFGTFPGIKIKRYQKVAVAIDTSGSVPDEDLSLFFAEIHAMWRQGAEIRIIECDADVQRTYPYTGKLPKSVAGRGGTIFDPVFHWLRQQRFERFDGCIYLTDGEAAAPSIKPPCKLLWIVTSDGRMGDHLKFGRSIQLPSD